MNIDTPRTDMQAVYRIGDSDPLVYREFARQLERELNDARAHAGDFAADCERLERKRDNAERFLAEALRVNAALQIEHAQMRTERDRAMRLVTHLGRVVIPVEPDREMKLMADVRRLRELLLDIQDAGVIMLIWEQHMSNVGNGFSCSHMCIPHKCEHCRVEKVLYASAGADIKTASGVYAKMEDSRHADFHKGDKINYDGPVAPGVKREHVNDAMSATKALFERMRTIHPLEFDPDGKRPSEPGAKLDDGKNRLGLVLLDFCHALQAVGRVGTYGANKYSDNGWPHVPNGIERYTDALLRHLMAEPGESHDKDSGLAHAAHVAWNALARLELMMRKLNTTTEGPRS